MGKSRNGATPSAIALAKRLGLRHVTTDALSIRRRRCGRGWAYIRDDGRPIRDARVQISRFRFFMGEPRSRRCR